jgi:SAM-dependent methyltransferase
VTDIDTDRLRSIGEQLCTDVFVDAVVRGARAGATPTYERIRIRPVDIGGSRHLQFERFDGRQTAVENLVGDAAVDSFINAFRDGMRTALVRTTSADLQVTIAKRGTVQSVKHAPTAQTVVTEHDRSRHHLISEDAPFLIAVGISTADGRVKPTARSKFRQVQRFVEILDATITDSASTSTLRIVDLGCGSGVLTLAAHHHLRERGIDVDTTGVDLKVDLMDRLNHTVADLGWEQIRFVTGSIADWHPVARHEPDLVIALHACDTATDDALAAAIGWSSRHILVAPCCQHDLQDQLEQQSPPPGFESLVRHGIVRERLGDLLTDTVRADICAALGWRTDVIEFVDGEHTAKNLMIRAVHTGQRDPDAQGRVEDLVARWGVNPALRRRLAD